MKMPRLSTMIGFLVFLLVMIGFMFFIIFIMASQVCEESEVKPVRYEMSGLFGNQKTLIETTEGNHDAYERVCIRKRNPSYWSVTENLEYMVNASKGDGTK